MRMYTKSHRMMSVDVEDLFYSLPRLLLFDAVRHCLERNGIIVFQIGCGVSVESSLEVLGLYLRSTSVKDENEVYYIQMNEICIGSCVAPI